MLTKASIVRLVAAAGIVSLGGACTKSAQEKKAETQQEAAKDVAEVRKDANEKISDIRKDEAKDVAKENKEISEETQDAAAKRFTDRFDKVNDAVDKLESDADKLDASAKAASANAVADAKAKKDAAKTKLDAMKDASADTWANMRTDVDTSLTEAEQAVATARQQVMAH